MFTQKSFIVVVIIFLMASIAIADVPTTMNYQGLLADAGGSPVADGSYSVVFTIYDDPSTGTSKWTETQNVTTTNGQFIVLLGSINPIIDTVFNDVTRYLGVKVEADLEITPRTALVTVPYSFRTSTVDGASGGNITSEVSIGTGHTITGYSSFVAGIGNTVSAPYIVVSGGQFHEATGHHQVIGGGEGNLGHAEWGTIGGGYHHTMEGGAYQSTISGGADNWVKGFWSTIAGGSLNKSFGIYSTVGGGYENTADGYSSTIPGGFLNVASGLFSFAAGRRAQAIHDGAFVWGDTTDADFTSTADNQFLIRAGGGVGINTNSPGVELDVNGIARVQASVWPITGEGMELAYNATDDIGYIHVYDRDGATWGNLYLGNGDVGIGTATPNYMLDVRGTIGNNATLHHSDRRWKENIVTLNKSLDKIQQLRGVSFDWKRKDFADMNFPEGKQIGLIAQEVEQVMPEVVNTGADGYKSVDYSKLVALLIEANKEQMKRIDELESKLSEVVNLKKLVEKLDKKFDDGNSTFGLK